MKFFDFSSAQVVAMEKHSSAMDSAVFFNKRVSKLVVFCYGVGHFLNGKFYSFVIMLISP